MNTTTKNPLRAKKVQVDAEIAVAEAARRGLALDLGVVTELIGRGVKFDRKFLSFLQQYGKGGDPNEFLRNLLTKKGELTAEDEEAVAKINSAISRGVRAFDAFPDRLDLYGYVNATLLKQLVDKASKLQGAVTTEKK
jgi:hypothetical protein